MNFLLQICLTGLNMLFWLPRCVGLLVKAECILDNVVAFNNVIIFLYACTFIRSFVCVHVGYLGTYRSGRGKETSI
jgi:hypothetical protein